MKELRANDTPTPPRADFPRNINSTDPSGGVSPVPWQAQHLAEQADQTPSAKQRKGKIFRRRANQSHPPQGPGGGRGVLTFAEEVSVPHRLLNNSVSDSPQNISDTDPPGGVSEEAHQVEQNKRAEKASLTQKRAAEAEMKREEDEADRQRLAEMKRAEDEADRQRLAEHYRNQELKKQQHDEENLMKRRQLARLPNYHSGVENHIQKTADRDYRQRKIDNFRDKQDMLEVEALLKHPKAATSFEYHPLRRGLVNPARSLKTNQLVPAGYFEKSISKTTQNPTQTERLGLRAMKKEGEERFKLNMAAVLAVEAEKARVAAQTLAARKKFIDSMHEPRRAMEAEKQAILAAREAEFVKRRQKYEENKRLKEAERQRYIDKWDNNIHGVPRTNEEFMKQVRGS